MYPASYDGVVSVSACKQDGETVSFDSSYSYFNDRVTVAAPGTGVQSLYLDGGTATKQGTSFAAPVVTAMAAMAQAGVIQGNEQGKLNPTGTLNRAEMAVILHRALTL